jgi:uncharacterized repeat protein (TIGR01451 family)
MSDHAAAEPPTSAAGAPTGAHAAMVMPIKTATVLVQTDRYQSASHTPDDLLAASKSAPATSPILSDRTAFSRRAAQSTSVALAQFESPQPVEPPTAPPREAVSNSRRINDYAVAAVSCPPGGCGPQPCYAPETPCDGAGGACCQDGAGPGPGDEYLCDGGDYGLPAAVIKSGEVTGLEQEDTVAHYETVDGRTIITPSKKVCVYSPRFAAVREVVDVRAYARYDMPEGAIQRQSPAKAEDNENPSTTLAALEVAINRKKAPPSLLLERQQPGELGREQRLAAVIGSLAPYANLAIVRTGELVGDERVKIARASLAAVTWTGVEAPQVLLDSKQVHAEVSVQSPGTIYLLVEPNNPKLRLCKLASKGSAQLGEEVEFTLRFDNVGDRVINKVTIVDHLTTRLEYVPDSQKSSLKASFSTSPDSNESLTLRWELDEPLKPGEGGILQFKTTVR